MKRAEDIVHLRQLLQRRRRNILEAALAGDQEVVALKSQGRDAEYEESAQVDLADYTLSHLLEAQRTEIMLIDGALARMDAGVFGECVDCSEPISIERLEALPFALRCEEDAERHEAERRAASPAATPSL
ncbi:MAG: TraR/DksA family transcriptional regulator [Myxococcaceae bacterium]